MTDQEIYARGKELSIEMMNATKEEDVRIITMAAAMMCAACMLALSGFDLPDAIQGARQAGQSIERYVIHMWESFQQ